MFEEVKKASPWRVGAHGEASLTRGPLWFIAGPLPTSATSNMPTKSGSSKKAHSNKKTPYTKATRSEPAVSNAEPTSLQLVQRIEENTRRTSFWVNVISWGVVGGWATMVIVLFYKTLNI